MINCSQVVNASYSVANATARKSLVGLTLGDIVKDVDTNLQYQVIDVDNISNDNGWSIVPAAQKLQIKTADFTAVSFGRYQTAGTIVVTDPVSSVLNDSFMVRIASGTATVGGTVYSPSRFDIVRYYNGSAWVTQTAVISGGLTVDGTPFSSDFSYMATGHPTASVKLPVTFDIGNNRYWGIIPTWFPIKAVSAISSPVPAIEAGTGLYLQSTAAGVLNARPIFVTDFDSNNFYLWGDGTYLYLSQSLGDTTNCFRSAYEGSYTAGIMTGQGTYTGTVTVAGTLQNTGAPGFSYDTSTKGIYSSLQRNIYAHYSFNANPSATLGQGHFIVPAGATKMRMCVVGSSQVLNLSLYWHVSKITLPNTAVAGYSGHVRSVTAATCAVELTLADMGIVPGTFVRVFHSCYNRGRNGAVNNEYVTAVHDLLTFY
jgi:hypothetical protein